MSSLATSGKNDIQARVIAITTDNGDPVKYSGNPAELAGARFETSKALRRSGAFKLLIKHNAVRLKNGAIAVEDINSIPLVTEVIKDPDIDNYDYNNPCPATPARMAAINAHRATRGEAAYAGIATVNAVPDVLLKLAIPNPSEVEAEALAFALTQLSVFEDVQHANELLVLCEYDGRKLAPLLDAIEAQATAEDVTLVTGRRNAFKEAGLKGLPLSYAAFRTYFKQFNELEYRCPPAQRLSDQEKAQLVGTLFIKDPSQRQNWSNHINQPVIRNAAGVKVSGPPETFMEAKLLAEKVLRKDAVLAGIDELSSPSGIALAVQGQPHDDRRGDGGQDPGGGTALVAHDPRKSVAQSVSGESTSSLGSSNQSSNSTWTEITVPKGEDGKYLYWAPPMSLCDCGTKDGGRHVKYKWPCAYYRKPTDGSEGGRGKGKGGKGKGKSDKGKGKGKLAAMSAEQVAAAVTEYLKTNPPSGASAQASVAASPGSDAAVSSESAQSCCIANYNTDTDLQKLLDSTSLSADLAKFFEETSGGPTVVVDNQSGGSTVITRVAVTVQLKPNLKAFTDIPPAPLTGSELFLNEWGPPPRHAPRGQRYSYLDRVVKDAVDDDLRRAWPALGSCSKLQLWNASTQWTVAPANRDRFGPEPCVSSLEANVNSVLHQSACQIDDYLVRDGLPTIHSIFNVVPCNSDFRPDVCGSSQFAFNVAHEHCAAGPNHKADGDGKPAAPIFSAPVDSGCTATCTNSIDRLVNVKMCDETFNIADGKAAKCTAIGDMPVLLKQPNGEIFRFTFTNVRYVPSFKFTLLSTKQLWREHRIDSRFADLNKLVFPTGEEINYDPRLRMYAVTMVSEPLLSASCKAARPTVESRHEVQSAYIGFHNIKSTSHIARLPSAQASELLHRRCHLGINKIRALPHVTSDAPKILSSAVPGTCVHCAASQVRKAGHSGSLDAPEPEPGVLHVDLKGPFPLSAVGKFRYAAFFIDEYARFVFVEYLHDKSEVLEATKRVIAKFNALVGTPVDPNGVALSKPKVRRLHRDHEGGLESHQFESFRAAESVHSTTSAPHDHDLNPIAESTINTISTLATAYKSQSGAPIGFWPEMMSMAVDWHNSAPQASVGSSTSDPLISPTQRFQLKLPKVMDLPAFGCRTVVLKPPNHQSKTTLATRGWVGMFLGRSPNAIGTYEVWVPAINRKVRSSSLTVDEEHFPWLGADAHQPLVSATSTAKYLADHLGSDHQFDEDEGPPEIGKPGDINSTPRPSLSFLNLFSGPYERKGGLSNAMRAFGWDSVMDVDNHPTLGGGWQDDLLNDEVYTKLLQMAHAGAWDAILAAFPCTTTTVSRCFDASVDGGDSGPPPVRDADRPDGLPDEELSAAHRRELLRANRLLDRTIEILIAAHYSPRRTTIVLENPSDRSTPGTAQHMADVSHGSLWRTSPFKRLRAAIPRSSMCTFANCRFGASSQKYITLWYTNDAARILDTLNGPEHQCNHPPGTHGAIAGGRDERGEWRSKETATYLEGLCVKIAMGFTFARTGDPTPLSIRQRREAKVPLPESHPAAVKEPDEPIADVGNEVTEENARVGDDSTRARDATPRRLSFGPMSPSSSSRAPTAPSRPSPSTSRSRLVDVSPARPINLGGGIPDAPRLPGVQDARTRGVRESTRAATERSLELQRLSEERARAIKAARATARRLTPAAIPETIPEEEPGGDAPYTSFSGSPGSPWGRDVNADDMEATVAGLVYETVAEDFSGDVFNLTKWVDVGESVPGGATRRADGTFITSATPEQIASVVARGGIDDQTHHILISIQRGLERDRTVNRYLDYASRCVEYGLRADSPGAPETYPQAIARGPPWPAAISKEFANHEANGSWDFINASEVPRGRRIHKFVWVFKEKRDGSAKARLCVQGCTLEAGVDFDQTFAKPLRHDSARGLFAFAARNRCFVRSVDFVAAYLQGEFLEGEVVYCHQPPGSRRIGSDGKPMVCVIRKPIYGIPQAGRRLQRKIFPWCRDVMGLRQLDDSDDTVFVWDDPKGKETFAIGIYVDNMQIVHSAEVDEHGDALDPNSFYARFIAKLREDWDVIDEGPMNDLLAMDCTRLDDGSYHLNQGRYVRKMLSRFTPNGPKHRRCSVPYSADLPRLVIEALEGSKSDSPAFPHLVKPYQQKVGALMYACTGTRPDLAYAVHQHCRCLSRPTPDLLDELEYVFSYLSEYPDLGIRFTPEDGVLHGTADASWEVRASTSGWIVYWHGAPLCWGSRKQKSVALSSCESEIVALSEAAKDVVYLRKFTRGLVPDLPKAPTVLTTDNKAARDLSYNPEHHGRSKHIERRHFFIRDMVEAMEIVVPLVNTQDNDADFFTKPLAPKRFKYLRRRVMNLSCPDDDRDHRSRGGAEKRGG